MAAEAPSAPDPPERASLRPRRWFLLVRKLAFSWRGLALTTTTLLALMVVQHFRHGWPFSLHHRMPSLEVPVGKDAPTAPAAAPRTQVQLDPAKLGAIGVTTERVRSTSSARTIRTGAVVVPDEGRVSHVHTRVSGWIEQLYVNETGQKVKAGQAIAAIFSQELLAAQNELLALQRATTKASPALLESMRSRLRVLGMGDRQIAAIEERRSATRVVTVSAPRGGVVLRRNVNVGTAVDPSTELVTIADLSRMWVFAEIAERDVPDVPVGAEAMLEFPAAAAAPLSAAVAFVYPMLSERTRTLRVRFELDDPPKTLRPGMYGVATFDVKPHRVLTVARDAIVDTGLGQHVFVVTAPGTFEPRTVVAGARFGERVAIDKGLSEGEEVVTSGVFLIDSESRLRASGGQGQGAHAHGHGAHDSPSASAEPKAPPTPRPASPPAHEHHEHGGHGG